MEFCQEIKGSGYNLDRDIYTLKLISTCYSEINE